MLKKICRLRSSTQIKRVLKNGKNRHIGNLLTIKWIENNLPNHRVAMVVSLKVHKRAVVRNRIRRVCLGAIAKVWLYEDATAYIDVVIIARRVTLRSLFEARDGLIKELCSITYSKKTT